METAQLSKSTYNSCSNLYILVIKNKKNMAGEHIW